MSNIITQKVCAKCELEKDLSEFHNCKSAKDGLQNKCKSCAKEYNDINKNEISKQKQEYYLKNQERICTRTKKYQKDNKEKVSAQKKEYRKANRKRLDEYYLKNQEYILERQRKYQKDNKEKILKQKKEYYQQNREVKLEKQKKYSREHKKEIAEYRRNNRKAISAHNRLRRKTDVQYKLTVNLRSRLRCALKSNQKSGSAVRDLGCTIKELKVYLENQFQEGMTWDNWSFSGWHLDHVIPLSSFDLTDRGQFLKASHYTNLQPLWAKDNLRKSNKLNY